jgi:hypothetical protein
LRIHGWLERSLPLVFVLTDGSGHGGQSRLASTARLLERAGARAGRVFGRFTDVALYQAMLARDTAVFTGIADEIAAVIAAEGVTSLIADAAEGYNPSHDVCRYLADTVATMSGLAAKDANFEFDLVAAPGGDANHGSLIVDLDDNALARKLDAARAYPEMAGEVEAALSRWGAAAFRREAFRRVPADLAWREPADAQPFYERHGERRHTEGIYGQVVRYADHVGPLREALRRHARTAPV